MTDEPRSGRPRKWASNAERMRAYRAVERERREALRGQHSMAEMAERVVELTAEHDRLWAQVVRLQLRIAQLENQVAGHPPTAPTAATAVGGLSRAERRRLEREQQRRRRSP